MKRVKIAMIKMSGGYGGVSRYADNLYKRLSHHESLEIKAINVKQLPAIGALSVTLKSPLFNLRNYQVVHNVCAYPLFPLLKDKAKLITTAYEFQALLYPEISISCNRTLKDRMWTRLVEIPSQKQMLSGCIFADSKQTEKEALRLGVDKKKVFYTPLSLEEKFITTEEKTEKTNKKFRVGYIGAIGPRKNVRFIINAIKKLPDKDIELELWGKSIYSKEELLGFIGGDIRIKLKGNVSESKIIEVYDSFDVFVYPSLYEGFGFPILEAQARGKPVIIYEKGYISEEVKKYCIKVNDEAELAQEIDKLKTEGYDQRISKKAEQYAKSFTWYKSIDTIVNAYANISSN